MPRIAGVDKSGLPVGKFVLLASTSSLAGILPCNGAAVSQASYPALFEATCPVLGAVVITIGGVTGVTLVNHGLATGNAFRLTTTGALPTGLSAGVDYFAVVTGTDTFWVSSNYTGALAGSGGVATSGVQSGVHTLRLFPFNYGGATSTQFNIPDCAGRDVIGDGTYTDPVSGAITRRIGQKLGAEKHAMTVAEMPSHEHQNRSAGSAGVISGGPYKCIQSSQGFGDNDLIEATGGSDTHNNMQPSLVARLGIVYL